MICLLYPKNSIRPKTFLFLALLTLANHLIAQVSDLFPYLTRRQQDDGIIQQTSLLTMGVLWVPILGQFIH